MISVWILQKVFPCYEVMIVTQTLDGAKAFLLSSMPEAVLEEMRDGVHIYRGPSSGRFGPDRYAIVQHDVFV